MAHPEPAGTRYRLGPRSTRGLIAGWRSGQIACVGLGLLLAVGFLRSVGGVFGGLLGLAAACGGVAVATWPVGGRTLEQWVPTVASFGVRAAGEGRRQPWQSPKRRPRGPLSRLTLLEMPELWEHHEPAWREGVESLTERARSGRGRAGAARHLVASTGIGVIGDAESCTWTAVMPVGGTGFALLGDAERADRIAAWSGVLAAMARDTSGLHRLQWLSSTSPAWLDGALSGGGTGLPGEHYGHLLEEVSPSLWTHEVYVAVSVRRSGAPWSGPQAPASLLREQLSSLDERLRSAGLMPGAVLTPRLLASFVGRSFEVAPLGVPGSSPWPIGVDNRWSRLRTDASWHASYWIAEWPRTEVGGGFLLPMLLEPGLRRVISVTMAPLPVLAAVRRAQRERTEGTADVELRQRHGFAVTARALREQEGRQQREAELAEGHAGYRYSGYVTVTEADQDALERSCGRLEKSAALAQLELRRLYGAQEEGYCCTLPSGRGCR
jgi:hypothetical protein